MFSVSEYIETGILELYILGIASDEERNYVERIDMDNFEILKEIEGIKA